LLPFGFTAFHLFGGRPHYEQIARSVAESLLAAISGFIIFTMYFGDGYIGVTYALYNLILTLIGFCIIYFCALFMISSRIRGEMKSLWRGFVG
jgi:hypothetical protein